MNSNSVITVLAMCISFDGLPQPRRRCSRTFCCGLRRKTDTDTWLCQQVAVIMLKPVLVSRPNFR